MALRAFFLVFAKIALMRGFVVGRMLMRPAKSDPSRSFVPMMSGIRCAVPSRNASSGCCGRNSPSMTGARLMVPGFSSGVRSESRVVASASRVGSAMWSMAAASSTDSLSRSSSSTSRLSVLTYSAAHFAATSGR
jgi:hypothetical protein